MITATLKSYVVYHKFDGRQKFCMSHVKHGNSSAVVRFSSRGEATKMKDILNISIARFGDWEGAVEKRGDDLVISDKMKDFESDAADFEYVDVESYDGDDVVKIAEIKY